MENLGRLRAGESLDGIHVLTESLECRMSYKKKEIWGSLRKMELGLGARTVVLLLDDLDMELNLSETQSRIYKLVV